MDHQPQPITYRQSLIAGGLLLGSLGCTAISLLKFWPMLVRMVLSGVGMVLVLALIAYVVRTLRGRGPVTLRLTPFGVIPVVCGIVVALGLWAIAGQIMGLLSAGSAQAAPPADPATALPVLYLAIGAPVLEELLFRGYLLTGFRQGMGDWAAIVATALLFAAFHLNAPGIPIYLATGLITAWLTVRTGSIFPAIICHAFGNMSSIWSIPSPLGFIESLPLSAASQSALGIVGNGLFVLVGSYGLWRSTQRPGQATAGT